MISRSLGPEFGGAMACLFFTAYVIGSTFHISGLFFIFLWNVGVVEIVMNTFLSDHDTQAIRITVGAVTLLVVAIVAMIGAESYGKFNRFLFLGQIITIWLTFGCMLFRKAPYVLFLSSSHTGTPSRRYLHGSFPVDLQRKLHSAHLDVLHAPLRLRGHLPRYDRNYGGRQSLRRPRKPRS